MGDRFQVLTTRLQGSAFVMVAVLSAGLLGWASQATAAPPPGYYNTVDATDSTTLRNTLHPVIDDHLRFPYTSGSRDTWDILEDADQDPNNAGNILDVYLNASYAKVGGGTGPYNREHSWPSSYGFTNDGSTNMPYTDCHHLILCNSGYNTSRSNLPYDTCNAGCTEKTTVVNNGQGGGSGTYPGNSNWRTGSGSSGTWETWIGKRGDVARGLFYMDIRYEGGTHNVTGVSEPDLILTDNRSLIVSNTQSNQSVAYMGMLATLLQWHLDDPVDANEMARNDSIFADQGNRNPFIDNPEWVDCLFNNVCGGGGCSVPADCDDGIFCNGAETCVANVCQSGSDPCPGQSCDEGTQACADCFNDPQCDDGLFCNGAETCVANLCQTGSDPCTPLSCDEVTDTCGGGGGPAGDPWINEFHYDNSGSDTGEFVEVAGAAGTDLTGWSVVGYNGSGGGTYKTVNLLGTIPDQGGCMGTLGFTFTSMQNGAPDGLALVDDLGAVVEFISYEGSFAATNGPASGMTSVDIGVAETGSTPIGNSLQLAGTGGQSSDFTWQAAQANTQGSPNTGQTFDGCGGGCTTDPECDDGIFCNGAETCVASACQSGTPVNCDDGVGCTDDSCNEATGSCDNVANDANCDNGLFCDGVETCDLVLDCQAGTTVNCGDGVGCTDDSCNEATNQCDNVANDGNCDNGLFCDGAETCDPALDCQAGTVVNCDDGVGCSDDSCNESTNQCDNAANDANCDNGLFCDGAETCDPILDCQAGTAVSCGDGVGCTDDSCNETTDSCDNIANDANCDDGLACNGAETCDALLDCQAGTAVNCDDAVACTDDACNEPAGSCSNTANNANCDNGLFCDGAETCDSVFDCQAGTTVNCNDGVGCTDDSCNETTNQCDNVANNTNCDNGLYCDGAETCDPALDCQAGTIVNCDDGVGCTDDSCNEVSNSCDNVVNNANCDDGLFCNGAETCSPTLDCLTGGDPCPGQACDEVTDTCVGCLNDPECDDGLFCNGTETCVTGTCQPGTAVNCDDGVGCTDDSCNEATNSCDNAVNDANCDNGLFCDGAETCDSVFDCQAGATVNCDDGVGCTDDSCNEATNLCDNVANNANCDNGLFCDGSETCDSVFDCQAGTTVNCDDGVGCTDDSCNESTNSCDNVANNANCDNGLFCDGAETCDPVFDCQSGSDPCTPLSCDEVTDTCGGGGGGPAGDPWINEFHYDNSGSDTGEFVEVAGAAGTDLTGWSVVGYNGSGGGTYKTVNLLGTIPDQGGCMGTLGFTFTSMQNGAPDGLALVDDLGVVMEFISYEGSFVATNGPASGMTSVDIGVAETGSTPIGNSLQLAGTGGQSSDFTWQAAQANTQGSPNTGQTFDGCGGGCTTDPECDDGIFCNGAETCVASACQPGTPVNCDDGVGCTDDSCNEATGSCDNVANDANCDNGLFCDGVETCDLVLDCQAGTTVNCGDGVGCTDDSCNEATNQCDNVANNANCDNGLFCDGSETCDPALDCQAGTVVNCDDGVGCTDDSCNEVSNSCDNVVNNVNCDDGLFCNGSETCSATLDCQAGGDPCPGQACDEIADMCVGCLTDPECDDGLFCNGAETCVTGTCQPGTAVNCDDGVGCTDDSCNEATNSCDNVANDANCDNGLFCDGLETCDSVFDCQAGTTVNCDDGVGCTDDSCNEATNSCDNVANDANCDNGLFCDGAETCSATLDCQAGGDPCPGLGCDEALNQCTGGGPTAQLEAGAVTVGGSLVTVTLTNTYTSPVVVCSIQYSNNTVPVVTRVSSVTPTSFDVRLQNPSGGGVATENVSYIVVEEGVWTIDGVNIEAQTYLSTVTDRKSNWNGQIQSYGQSYTNPVVVGQVMSENDALWSFFWCRGASRQSPPSATDIRTGKGVAEDNVTSRADETVGFIVFEAGHGTIGGVEFEASVGVDTVRGIDNSPAYTYSFNTAFASAPTVAVTTMAAMDGNDGGWAQIHGGTMASSTSLFLSIDEDQIGGSERRHTTEQVGYVVFATTVVSP